MELENKTKNKVYIIYIIQGNREYKKRAKKNGTRSNKKGHKVYNIFL